MKEIYMNILTYNLDENGITQSLDVAFTRREGPNNFNARIQVDEEDLDLDFANASRRQIEVRARQFVRDWIMYREPEEEPIEEETTE